MIVPPHVRWGNAAWTLGHDSLPVRGPHAVGWGPAAPKFGAVTGLTPSERNDPSDRLKLPRTRRRQSRPQTASDEATNGRLVPRISPVPQNLCVPPRRRLLCKRQAAGHGSALLRRELALSE